MSTRIEQLMEAKTLGDISAIVASHLRSLWLHMLKYQFQPLKQTSSWIEQCFEELDWIQKSISGKDGKRVLRNFYKTQDIEKIYDSARDGAVAETGMLKNNFPPYIPEDFIPFENISKGSLLLFFETYAYTRDAKDVLRSKFGVNV